MSSTVKASVGVNEQEVVTMNDKKKSSLIQFFVNDHDIFDSFVVVVELVGLILVVIFGLSAAMMFFSHMYILARNESTLDDYTFTRNPYDLGSIRKNLEQTLGTNVIRCACFFIHSSLILFHLTHTKVAEKNDI